jgi:hypothetical protein
VGESAKLGNNVCTSRRVHAYIYSGRENNCFCAVLQVNEMNHKYPEQELFIICLVTCINTPHYFIEPLVLGFGQPGTIDPQVLAMNIVMI